MSLLLAKKLNFPMEKLNVTVIKSIKSIELVSVQFKYKFGYS